jgi:CubicO group peptidase (beta-lactamase class C family)
MDRSPISKAGLRKRLEDLEPVIDGICRVAGTPGISIAVSYQGEVIHRLSSGYSNLETSRPVTRSTQFPIGTMMKTFTAAAASILVNEGKLTWNTPIRAIIPELETQSQVVTENLTVVDLLSHRSGLGRSNLWWQGAESTLLLDKKDLVPFYNTLPSTGNFRGGWAYSNWGYALVGEVIERLSGKTFAEYLKEKIFDPLGLKNTTVNLVDPASTPDLARPYAALDDTSPYLLPQSPILGDTIMAPALGGVSTAEDPSPYQSNMH